LVWDDRVRERDCYSETGLKLSGIGGFGEQLFFAVNELGDVIGGEFEAVSVGDGVGRAGLHAISAKDAAVVVDVVDRGVALAGADARLGGIFRRFNINAVGGAGGGAEETGDAFFQAGLVALKICKPR